MERGRRHNYVGGAFHNWNNHGSQQRSSGTTDMMITCTQTQYDAARAANPSAFILCEDTVHPPDGEPFTVSPSRRKKAMESPYSEPYQP